MDTSKIAKQLNDFLHSDLAPIQLIEVTEPLLQQTPTRNGSVGSAAIGVGDQLPPDVVLGAVRYTGLQHLIQVSSPVVEKDALTSTLMLSRPKLFMRYPLRSIFDPESTMISQVSAPQFSEFAVEFRSHSDKQNTLDSLEEFVVTQTTSNSIKGDILLIADELFTNSVRAISNHEPTFSQVKGAGRLIAGSDGERLVIGCIDPGGGLRVSDLIGRLHDCYIKGLGAMMTFDRPGAGIGSHMIFSRCLGYYVAVERNQTTVVCVSVSMNKSAKKRSELSKSFHCVESERK